MTTTAPRLPLWRQLLAPYAILSGHRNFSLLLAVHTVSRLVQWLYLISLFVLVYQITHSPGIVALLTFVRILPNAFMLPISGALTDRINVRALMMISLGGRALCMIVLLGVHSRGTIWLAFVGLFGATVASALFRPALMTLLPVVVDDRHLLEATSLVTQAEFLTQGFGPALGGVLIVLGDIYLAFVGAAVAFASGILLLLIALVPGRLSTSSDRDESWLEQMLGGYLFMVKERDHVLIALSLALAAIGVINGAGYTLVVVLSDRAFHFGGQGADFLNGVYGIGSLAGGLLVGPLVSRRSLAPVFLGMGVVDCAASIAFGFSPDNLLPFLFMAMTGLADTATKVVGISVLQIAVPRALFGRVFGAFESSLLAGQAVGSLLVGPVITIQGPRVATFSLTMIGVAGILIAVPWVLRLEEVYGLRMFLRHVPALTALAATVLDELAARFRMERFAAGMAIVREGERGDRFYIVRRGRVDVEARGDRPEPSRIASLSRMDYFGEIGLLKDVPRTATIRACSPVEVYSLGRADFEELLARSQAFRDSLDGVTTARELDLQLKLVAGM